MFARPKPIVLLFAHTKVDCCNIIETEKMYKTDLFRPNGLATNCSLKKTSYDTNISPESIVTLSYNAYIDIFV